MSMAVTGYITEILGAPEWYVGTYKYGWSVQVKYDLYGQIKERRLIFDTEEEAVAVKVGDPILG